MRRKLRCIGDAGHKQGCSACSIDIDPDFLDLAVCRIALRTVGFAANCARGYARGHSILLEGIHSDPGSASSASCNWCLYCRGGEMNRMRGSQALANEPRYPAGVNAEEWLAAIVQSCDDAIIGESLDGKITSWNAAAERIFGYSAEEVIGHSVADLAWPGMEGEARDLLERISRGERVWHIRTSRRRKTGEKVIVSLILSPIEGPDGKLIGVAKIARDITDRVALEESLVERDAQIRLLTEREAQVRAEALAESRFRDLIQNAPDGILQVDEQGAILIANVAAETMFGYSEGELLGANVDVLVPAAGRAAHAHHRAAFSAAGVARPMGLGLHLSARRKDGSEFPVEISLSPTHEHEGVRVTAAIRDVTERRRMEQQVRLLQESYMAELVSRQKEAERLNQMKADFVAGVSHELRTPLHTIIGFADLMNEEIAGPLTETQRDFLTHIRKDSQHLLTLINDVLDLSRIEAGGLQVNLQKQRLQPAVAEAAGAIQPHAQAKGVALRYQVADEVVLADATRLRQVFDNLLSNAVKFTPPGGHILIAARPDGDRVNVTVSDTGIGISEKDQARVFDRFYQVGYAKGGAGLGLAITKQLVQMHGGTISVDSEPGKGSRFQFSLQRAAR